jgi:hypothetical protein
MGNIYFVLSAAKEKKRKERERQNITAGLLGEWNLKRLNNA